AAHAGDEESALEELRLFLSESLSFAPAWQVSRHALAAEAEPLQVLVPLPGLEGEPPPTRPAQRPRLSVPAVLLPPPMGEGRRARWAIVPRLRQTVFLDRDDEVLPTLEREIARLIDAESYDAAERLALLPGVSWRLVPMELQVKRSGPLDGLTAGLRGRLEKATRAKAALEVLSDVARPLHATHAIAQAPQTVGRDDELALLRDLLAGDARRSVLLVGPEGSGKSALVQQWVREHSYGVELRVDGPTPGKRLAYQTSGAQLIAGMSLLGQWQARVERVVLAAETLDAVLYFDDLGDLFDARSGDAHVDLPGAFKPALEQGRLRMVAELTPEAHDRLAARHEGFFACFTVIGLEGQDRKAAHAVLDARAAHAKEHEPERPRVTDEGRRALLHLAERYLADAAFPGKAARLYEELRDAADRPGHGIEGDLGPAAVVRLFSLQTGIPELLLRDDRALDAAHVAEVLGRRVVGQRAAVRAVAETLAVVKAALQPADKPLATFLFAGPTGVGKTELARALAGFLYGDEQRLLRFDMSELADPWAVQRLVSGAGGERGEGLLTRRVRQQPFAVLLFDEVEKAHPAFFDLLLQIAGEGRLTDGAGRVASFKNTLVILTSNLGAQHEGVGRLGFGGGAADADARYLAAVREAFRPELVGRLDRVIPFAPLTPEETGRIASILLGRIADRRGLTDRGATLTVSEGARQALSEAGYSAAYGARALRRSLDQTVAAPIARGLSAHASEGPFAIHLRLPNEGPPPGRLAHEAEAGPARLHFVVRKEEAAASLDGLEAAFALRRELARGLTLPAVEARVEAEDFAKARMAQLFSPRRNRKGKLVPPPKADGVEVATLQRALHQAELLLTPLRDAQGEAHALEELLLDAMQAREPLPDVDAERRALRQRFRMALLEVLLETDRRDMVLALVEELDAGRTLDHWLGSLLREHEERGWSLTFHVRGETGWRLEGVPPEKLPFGPERSPKEMRARLEAPERDPLSVLLRVRGPHAGTILACEAGLHRYLGVPPLADGAFHRVRTVAFRTELRVPRDLRHPALHPSGRESPSRLLKLPAERYTDLRAQPSRAADYIDAPPADHWKRAHVDELALRTLIRLDEAGSRASLYAAPLEAPTAAEVAKQAKEAEARGEPGRDGGTR
ncbi:MAG: AAA family ATPase, partial [Myxococcota bacterium]